VYAARRLVGEVNQSLKVSDCRLSCSLIVHISFIFLVALVRPQLVHFGDVHPPFGFKAHGPPGTLPLAGRHRNIRLNDSGHQITMRAQESVAVQKEIGNSLWAGKSILRTSKVTYDIRMANNVQSNTEYCTST
jgi:hypothetical protein